MQARIEQTLAASLGYEVPVFLRRSRAGDRDLGPLPFPRFRALGRWQARRSRCSPSRSRTRRAQSLNEHAGDSDLLAFGPLELHWLPRAGVLDSALDMLSIEAITGPMTMRTIRTVRELAGKHLSPLRARQRSGRWR